MTFIAHGFNVLRDVPPARRRGSPTLAIWDLYRTSFLDLDAMTAYRTPLGGRVNQRAVPEADVTSDIIPANASLMASRKALQGSPRNQLRC